MLPRVTVNASTEMVEFSLFNKGNRLASSHAAVEAVVKVDAIRPNNGIPMIEIRFKEPEAALRLARAALDVWQKWNRG